MHNHVYTERGSNSVVVSTQTTVRVAAVSRRISTGRASVTRPVLRTAIAARTIRSLVLTVEVRNIQHSINRLTVLTVEVRYALKSITRPLVFTVEVPYVQHSINRLNVLTVDVRYVQDSITR